MNSKLALFIFSIMIFGSAQAVTVKSDSKYLIIVEVYEYKSVCAEKGSSEASKIFKNAKKANQDAGFFTGLREGVQGVIKGSGCNRIGAAWELPAGQSINVPAGTLIVAYKDPIAALKNSKKVVNPLPAVVKVPDSGTVLLQTRKSSTLGALIGMKGDGGLKAVIKK